MKDYFVYYYETYAKDDPRENLTELFESDYKEGTKNENTKCVSAMINEGIYFSRVDKCMTAEAFLDYPDSELKNAVLCSADYVLFKKNNESFVLTRTSTLTTGPSLPTHCTIAPPPTSRAPNTTTLAQPQSHCCKRSGRRAGWPLCTVPCSCARPWP